MFLITILENSATQRMDIIIVTWIKQQIQAMAFVSWGKRKEEEKKKQLKVTELRGWRKQPHFIDQFHLFNRAALDIKRSEPW